ncbi:MAG: metal-dependent hydrolase [Planctomycetota bacterium]
MDSVSQFVLGGSLAGAVLARHGKAWRAVLWGGVVATLPDLDVLIDHGDPIANMVAHRGWSHSLFWLTLAAPVLAFGIAALHGERARFRSWWLAVWLALFTHPLLDAMTIYGTRILLPFSDHAFAVGSLFIIDPLYTVPLLVGCVVLGVGKGSARSRQWNLGGLVASSLYAAWSVVAQQLAIAAASASLATAGIAPARLVVTAAPLQTVLWRVLAVTETTAYEGFWSLLDDGAPIEWTAIDRGAGLLAELRGSAAVLRAVAFSQDCCKLERVGDEVRLADLRMGQEPYYVFTFVVGRAANGGGGALAAVEPPVKAGLRIPIAQALPWLWRRVFGERIATPR